MKEPEVTFIKFPQETKQFVVPIYQRTVSWAFRAYTLFQDDIEGITEGDSAGWYFGY